MTATSVARPRISGERLFFSGMALLVLLSTFLGFAPTYYLRFAGPPPHPVEPLIPLVFAHGLVFSAWVLLFVTQTLLVATGRLARHKTLGVLALVLALAMIPLGIAVGIGGIHRPLTAPPGISPLSWAAIPLLDVPVFGGLILVALHYRRQSQVHKRLMLCAMVDMLRPSLGRLLPALGVPGALPLLLPMIFLLPLIAYDLITHRKVQPATAWGTLVVVVASVLPLVVWNTPAWLAFAGWLGGL